MSTAEEYYKALAEAREFNLDTVLKPSIELLSVSGVVVSMVGEVTAYAIKNGKNEKYKTTMDRINIISDFVDSCNRVNDHNYRLRWMLKNSIYKRDLMEAENEKLKKELESIKAAINAE